MNAVLDETQTGTRPGTSQRADDLSALLHFSAYIAREAARLGIPAAAERARMIEQDLLQALICQTD